MQTPATLSQPSTRVLVPGSFGEPHFTGVTVNERGQASGYDAAIGFVPIWDLTSTELDEMEAEMKLTERDFANAMFLQRLKITQRRFKIAAENEAAA